MTTIWHMGLISLIETTTVQEGLRTTEIEPYAMQQLQLVDPDGTGKMDFDQFVTFYQSVSTTKARSELRSALGPQAESES